MDANWKTLTWALIIVSSVAHAQFDEDDEFGDDFASPAPTGSPRKNEGPSASGSSVNSMDPAKKDRLSKARLEEITNENFGETIESFDFPNADIGDVVKAISELTGRNFIIDPGVRGKISIIAPSKITVAEAYKAFLSALAIAGFAVVPGDGFYKIRTGRQAQRDGIETYSGD